MNISFGLSNVSIYSTLLSVPTERRSKRELVARSVSEGISTLRTELRDSLRSNKSSLLLRSRSQSLHSLADTLAIATI